LRHCATTFFPRRREKVAVARSADQNRIISAKHLGALVHRVEKGAVTTRTHPDLRHTTGLRLHGGAPGAPATAPAKKTA
jgi:hypothetical protein